MGGKDGEDGDVNSINRTENWNAQRTEMLSFSKFSESTLALVILMDSVYGCSYWTGVCLITDLW